MAPMIQRRPSRIIADLRAPRRRPEVQREPSVPTVMSPEEDVPLKSGGFSAGSRQVLLRVFVRASADVQFNTTISA